MIDPILIYCLVIPLVALSGLRLLGRFPFRLTAIVFFIAPLIGAVVLNAFSELSRPIGFFPDPFIILVSWPFALLFFGPWSAFFAAAGWRLFGALKFARGMARVPKLFFGVILGSLIGAVLVFSLWSFYSQYQFWPDKTSDIASDPLLLASLLTQGLLAGAVSGGIIASYLDTEPTAFTWLAFRQGIAALRQRVRELI
jgi:hypothetical protein